MAMYTETKILKWKERKVENKGFPRLLAAVHTGCFPVMAVKKMSHFRLEHFVNQLVKYSKDEFFENSRPKWWPKYLEFVVPIRKLKMYTEVKNWGSTLRNVIISCSEFYKFNFLSSSISQKSFTRSQSVDFLESQRSTRVNSCWTYRCRANNRAVLIRRRCAVLEKNDTTLFQGNRSVKYPYVKLYDVTKNPNHLLGVLKVPKVKLVDILKYPLTTERKKRKVITSSLENSHSKLSKLVPHVRLHDLFEKPKDVQYSKDNFMKYFCLTQDDLRNEPRITHNKTVLSRILRNNNIPLSSDLGRFSLPTKHVLNCEMQRKTQKIEWYLREVPEVKSDQEYLVTYSADQNLDVEHNYVFPKRQQYQTHLNLRLYSQLKKCKPVHIRLERMNFQENKDKYKIIS